jgi:antitoxin ChpS
MHKATLRAVGGSVMVAIPKPLLETLGLGAGAAVALGVEEGRLVVEGARRKRYSLDELLAQCDPKARRSAEERSWMADKPKGRELL